MITRVSMWSARHGRHVVLAWLAVVVAAIVVSALVPPRTEWSYEPPGEAGKALHLIQDRFHIKQSNAQELVVFASRDHTVDDPVYKQTVTDLMQQLSQLRSTSTARLASIKVTSASRVVSGTLTYYDAGVPRDQSPFVAERPGAGDVTFALVSMEGDATEAGPHTDEVAAAIRRAQDAAPGFTIVSGGTASVNEQTNRLVEDDLKLALVLNLVLTLAVLMLVFRALVAAVVPLVLALTAVITAFAIVALISQVYALSPMYSEMVLLMGLATGIDYALFVISRFRRERNAGKPRDDALQTAMATSGKSVVFAGTTVVFAVCGMFLVRDKTFTSLGLASVIVVMLAIIISMTLLPAVLGLLGDNVNRLALPFLRSADDAGGGIWGFITDRVMAHPAVIATVTVLVLLAAAAPILSLNLGFNGAKGLPDAVEAKKALLALEDNFTLGLTSPAQVVVTAGANTNVFAPDVQHRVDAFIGSVKSETASIEHPDATYGAPIQTSIDDSGDTEIIRVPINADTGEPKAIVALNHIRNDLIPAAFENSGTHALVGGETAANIDFRSNIIYRAPFVFAFVLGLAFIILLVTFRSIVVALKAIVLNMLSVGATYGLLVLVFQRGWLLEPVLGFEATGIIESWLPLFLFAILFGLSMDYHMFVLGRIKEAYESGETSREAVSTGIKATAGTISSAAVIMVVVAMIFAFTRLIGLKQFGFGLAVAILLDATIIRSVLLPASMELLGDANWYLPRWLRWLPEVRMAE